MRKFIIFLLIFSISTVCTEAYQTVVAGPAKYQNYYNSYRPALSISDLTALEKYAFNRIYPRDYPLARLERLEDAAFGCIQNGDLATRYKNVENAILSRPNSISNVNRRNWLGGLANYFAGQATGLTPSVVVPNYDNYSPVYGPNYGTQRYESFSNGIFGGGYNMMNQNYILNGRQGGIN